MDSSARPTAAAMTGTSPLVIFLFLMLAMFMATLDNQIVSTALPTIVAEFGALERFGWIGSAYLLAMSAVMPLYGKFGDLFGRKYVMIFAVTLFTLGSVLCGLAWSMNSLIAARVIQGLGGGGVMVSIFSIVADLFEPRERARYQSYSSLVIMASGSVGPLLGGTMSEMFGWRSIFLINVPIGIVVVTALFALLPNSKPDRKPAIDYIGALLLVGATTSVVLWTDSGQIFGSLVSWQSLAIIAFGALCAMAWVKVEARATEPIVPLRLFKDSTFGLFLVVSLMIGGTAIGMVNYMALFLQTTMGLAPSATGLFFIAVTGGIVAGAIYSGRVISRTGRYKPVLMVGLTLNALALAAMSQAHATTPLWLVGALLFLQGLGVGLGQQAPIIGVQNSAPKKDVGAATGAVTLMRMAGAAIAISIYGAIIGSQLGHLRLGSVGVDKLAEITPAKLATLPEAARMAVAEAYGHAFQPLFLAASALALTALVATFFLKPVQLPTATHGKSTEKFSAAE